MTIRSLISSVRNFFDEDIYSETDNNGPVRGRAFRALRAIFFSIKGFYQKSLSDRASAMTYNTLLAAVPVLALLIVVGRGFGVQESLNAFIMGIFKENFEAADTVMEFANRYLEYMQKGTFVGVGIFVLLAAVVGLLRQIETQFNRIWNVTKGRPIVRQVATYFTIMVLIPMLIVVASGIKPAIAPWVLNIMSYLMVWVVLTLVYALMPNTKVRFGSALTGAIVAGTVLILLETLYVTGQVSLTKYNAVYGGFAALPLFLFWVHISWLIIMYGAELSYATQNYDTYIYERKSKQISRGSMDCLTMVIIRIVIEKFTHDGGGVSISEIARDYSIPGRITTNIIATLEQTGILAEVVSPDDERRWMPAMDINTLTMGRVLTLLRTHGNDTYLRPARPTQSQQWFIAIRSQYAAIWDAALTAADDIRLRDI